MALDAETRKGFDGRELPLDLVAGDTLLLHWSHGTADVEFVEYTGEVALPREHGAVIRFAYASGVTDTAVAGELSLPPRPPRHLHVRSYWSRCDVCGEQGVYNAG